MAEVLLSKRDTLVLKGGGILLMLFHHLFNSEWSRPLYDDVTIHGVGIVNQLGIFCKLCVAVFVFASGYGLTVSTPNNIKLKNFYLHRFKKLYLNYWFIWLLLVPISVFVFGRTFTEAYGTHTIVKAVLDFFGLLKMFGFDSYNPTWWFYNCIIVLYLLFPLLNNFLWRSPFLVVTIATTLFFFNFIMGINVISSYLIVFVTGMLATRIPAIWLDETKWYHVVIALALLSIWRISKSSPKQIVDSFLCLGFALLLFKTSLCKWLNLVFQELGKHSMNMFLTHTFIFYYWYRDYIYISRNPLIIFLLLVISTYLLSLAIEWTKHKVGFYKI